MFPGNQFLSGQTSAPSLLKAIFVEEAPKCATRLCAASKTMSKRWA